MIQVIDASHLHGLDLMDGLAVSERINAIDKRDVKARKEAAGQYLMAHLHVVFSKFETLKAMEVDFEALMLDEDSELMGLELNVLEVELSPDQSGQMKDFVRDSITVGLITQGLVPEVIAHAFGRPDGIDRDTYLGRLYIERGAFGDTEQPDLLAAFGHCKIYTCDEPRHTCVDRPIF